MAGKTKVTEDVFLIAKALILSDKTYKEIQSMTQLSAGTLYNISKANDYAAYRARVNAYAARARDRKRAVNMNPIPSENVPMRTPAPAQAPTRARTSTPARTPAKNTRTQARARAVASTTPGSQYYGSTRLVELMIQQNKLLELISNKLAFIVEQLA